MAKYEPKDYRCNECGEFYHTENARDACEESHREGE